MRSVMKIDKLKLGVALVAVMAGGGMTAEAQKMVKVSGVVYNTSGHKKVPFSDISVEVYAIKTVAEAKDIKKLLDSNDPEKMLMLERESVKKTDENGYYEILVPDNGALIFKAGMNEAVLEKVNHRMKIDVGIEDGERLDEVLVVGVRTELKPEPKAPRLMGNLFMPYNTFDIPARMGNSYSRLIIQPYVMDCETDDTIAFTKPLVYDGKEYALTQERKMGYDMERDPLKRFISERRLTAAPMRIEWSDTVRIPDPEHNYSCFASISIEDYQGNEVNTFQVSTCEAKRPMKFLEYDLAFEEMDPDNYKERPQIEKRNTSDLISLNFVINSDELTDTEENRKNIEMLRSKLKGIADSPGTVVKEFHVTGTASPDGSYHSNLALAERRMRRVEREITSILPPYTLERVYRNPQANVAPWEEVIKLMERDGKLAEAEEMKKVTGRYKGIQEQGAHLRQLSFYKSLVTQYLEELRTVKYNCVYEIYREPNDEEIMDLYRKNGLKGSYTRYEYWRLFKLIKDEKELEGIYRKAYEESLEEKRPWVLAGNNLAVMYLKQGRIDTDILNPLIDKTIYLTDYKRSNLDNTRTEIINPVQVVNNQLCMLIRKGDFEEASIMAKILPDEERFDLLKAYAWAMGGYFHGGSTPEEQERARKTFETIKNSSPRNAVVMYLALETREGDVTAGKLVEALPQDEALTWYFKAVLAARQGDSGFTNATIFLSECFKRDKGMIPTAQNDGEFNAEIIKVAQEMSEF